MQKIKIKKKDEMKSHLNTQVIFINPTLKAKYNNNDYDCFSQEQF